MYGTNDKHYHRETQHTYCSIHRRDVIKSYSNTINPAHHSYSTSVRKKETADIKQHREGTEFAKKNIIVQDHLQQGA